MSNIDRKIEQELAAQAFQLDKLMREEQGLGPMIRSGFNGGLRPLMIVAYLLAILLAGVILYTGYQFLTVDSASQSYWGVLLLLAFQAQMGTKIWIWLEMNRASTMREIKRLELAVAIQNMKKPMV